MIESIQALDAQVTHLQGRRVIERAPVAVKRQYLEDAVRITERSQEVMDDYGNMLYKVVWKYDYSAEEDGMVLKDIETYTAKDGNKHNILKKAKTYQGTPGAAD